MIRNAYPLVASGQGKTVIIDLLLPLFWPPPPPNNLPLSSSLSELVRCRTHERCDNTQ